MRIRYEHDDWRRLAVDKTYQSKLPSEVVSAYWRALNFVKRCVNEQEIRAWKGSHFEKYEDGYSLRLNRQYRIVFDLEGEAPNKVFAIWRVENYHKG